MFNKVLNCFHMKGHITLVAGDILKKLMDHHVQSNVMQNKPSHILDNDASSETQ